MRTIREYRNYRSARWKKKTRARITNCLRSKPARWTSRHCQWLPPHANAVLPLKQPMIHSRFLMLQPEKKEISSCMHACTMLELQCYSVSDKKQETRLIATDTPDRKCGCLSLARDTVLEMSGRCGSATYMKTAHTAGSENTNTVLTGLLCLRTPRALSSRKPQISAG
jgi:hypothetical protein